MDVLYEIFQGLEFAFQKHEKEFVIELASDRVLHQIGVYLILILALISKLTEFAGGNLSCYYANNATKYDKSFLTFAENHCWESPFTEFVQSSEYSCKNYSLSLDGQILENDAVTIKSFIQWMPYMFLAEAVVFALPSILWHNLVGGRVTGHLQFVKSFLHDIYENYKVIPAGMYRKKAYDKESIYLDGWRSFKKDYKTKQQQGMTSGKFKGRRRSRQSDKEPIYETELENRTLQDVISALFADDFSEEEDEVEKDDQPSQKEKNVAQLLDRHLFSMLCYENFASFEYHPYIMSVQALTATSAAEIEKKAVQTMQQGILRQLCHKENFSGTFLTRFYFFKCILRLVTSFSMLVGLSLLFSQLFIQPLSTKTFLCDIPFHDVCIICAIKKQWDTMGIFLVNSCIVFSYFCLSVFQFYFVRFGYKRALCYYLEDILDSFSVAQLSAHIAKQD